MDPNLFRVDWGRLLEVLAAVTVLSFVVERALALVFEHKLYVEHLDKKGFKEPIAYGLSLIICVHWDFDVVSVVLTSEATSLLGQAVTAGVIAGGSKGSVKLFHDVFKAKSRAFAARPP